MNKNILLFSLVMSLTLGLAPFAPEPHIVGKIRWIAGGAVGMQPIDWFDTLLHGLPWLLFFSAMLYTIFRKLMDGLAQKK